MYKIEIAMSGAKEDAMAFEIVKGNSFGNLVVSDVSGHEVFFDYVHPDFDFKLFLAINDDELSVGFIEYTGQFDASLGQKLYSILLLESTARLLENYYIA